MRRSLHGPCRTQQGRAASSMDPFNGPTSMDWAELGRTTKLERF